MNRGDKVKDVLLDSIKMKQNDDNLIDKIEGAYTEEALDELESFQNSSDKENDEKADLNE